MNSRRQRAPEGPLLVLDIDHTLCASLPYDGVNWAEWQAGLLASDPPVVPGAQEGVARIIADERPSEVIFSTARSEVIRDYTRRWLDRHFPALEHAQLVMRQLGDSRRSENVKIPVVEHERGTRRVVIVDDDPAMIRACRRGDRFHLAPDCWAMLSGGPK
jgi:hypothetical protein